MGRKKRKDRIDTYILTNNPEVYKVWGERVETDFQELDLLAFFKWARDRVHGGEILLSHPLSSSIKPGETPYKSLLMERAATGAKVDSFSLEMLEAAIAACEKFLVYYGQRLPHYSERVHRDFQLIDLSVINSALQSAGVDTFI